MQRFAATTGRLRMALTMGAYHFVFAVGFLVYVPLLAWRMLWNPSYRRGIRERMGWVPPRGDRRVVWIHGVSVGELKAAGTLIARLRARFPAIDIVVSSTTPTGHALACKLHADLRVIYYPLDFGPFPRRALDRLRPACVLLVELEVWPNFLQAAARRGVPVVVVNGRMSERSFRGYRRIRGFLPQFNLILKFCVQDESYQRRLLALAVDPQRITVTGNIKYDSVMLRDADEQAAQLRSWLATAGRLVLVCGSTHADEEVRVARVLRAVEARLHRPIRLVVAPRHPERAASVCEALAAEGWSTVTWSAVSASRPELGSDIVVVDTIGQLETFYGACDVAFVGGSLVPRGGQNMLEPAALGRAVVFGPHVANFRADVSLLLEAQAAVQVRDDRQLQDTLERLFGDVQLRVELGARAVALIRSNQGATERTLAVLSPLLEAVLGGGGGTAPAPASLADASHSMPA